MDIRVSVADAQAHLSEFLDKVEHGDHVILLKGETPIAEISRIAAPNASQMRPLGLARGMGEVLPDFFKPLPDDLVEAFNGKLAP